ncbi:MAG: RlmE family RNA methyltransferase [Kofleriaceae bacterium]|jgi:23S rRNA (uridine2552-2'-O)-methyltransferase|nr:RlmE family RNA methyltransferase [Kofleriaceae bacterium]MBP9168968.1 RlmE family RNA methyltransferase [Kofleriaceae bacterium]MBP9858821.1 RlmE family RNA methyltransferase [Kofleriaceae bacterium]
MAKGRSKLGDRRVRHDHFHDRAKDAGFRARAVYKLEEIDRAIAVFRPGDRVCDLGCAPGSWLQYARTRIGDGGAMVGIDRVAIPGVPGARLLVGDVFTVVPADLLGDLPAFDVVLSDMAPDTTGIRHLDQARSEALFERALELATLTLAPGGRFVGKLFQGPDFQKLIALCRSRFATVKVMKPASSRQISIEQYVTAAGFKGRGS